MIESKVVNFLSKINKDHIYSIRYYEASEQSKYEEYDEIDLMLIDYTTIKITNLGFSFCVIFKIKNIDTNFHKFMIDDPKLTEIFQKWYRMYTRNPSFENPINYYIDNFEKTYMKEETE